MAYTPTTWNNDDVITAEKLNKLEQGVKNEQVGPAGPAGPVGPAGPAGAVGPAGPTSRTERRQGRTGRTGTSRTKLHSSSGEQNNAGRCETDGFDCRFVHRNSN